MTHHTPPEHFKGKSVAEHLKDARLKGANAIAEVHGTEIPGHLSALTDSCKNTCIIFLIFWAFFTQYTMLQEQVLHFFLVFSLGWIIWTTGRSALLAYDRLERLHRLIEEERWEITHHREQEKLELTEMYRAKGFSGKLLEDVIEVLVADDERLLRVMLEEELGLTLEAYEHPLKQSFGAFLGTLIAIIFLISAYFFFPPFGIPVIALIFIGIASYLSAKLQNNHLLPSIAWNLSIALFATLGVYLLVRVFLPLLNT